ncbi:MAG: hypothetical protein ABIF06_01075 [bacterium]
MLIVVLLLASVSNLTAQTWQVSSLTATHGKAVLSSGLNLDMVLERTNNPNHTIELNADDGQGWILYDVEVVEGLQFGGNVGFLSNTPFFGGRVIWKPTFVPGLTLMGWPGVSVGEKFGEPSFEHLNFGINSGFAFLDIGPFTASYVVLKFEDNDTQFVPGIAFTQPITENYKFSIGGARDLTKDEYLFSVALRWEPSKR